MAATPREGAIPAASAWVGESKTRSKRGCGAGGVRGVFQQCPFLCLLSRWGRCQKGRGKKQDGSGVAAFGGACGSPCFLLSPLFCGEGTGPGAEPNPTQLGSPGQVERAAGTASICTPGAFLHLHLPCWHGVMPSGLSAPATASPGAGVALSTAEPLKPSRWER